MIQQSELQTSKNDLRPKFVLSRGSYAGRPLPIRIQKYVREHVTLLEVAGEIDALTVTRLRDALEDTGASLPYFDEEEEWEPKTNLIVFDLRDVDFFHIAGLSILAGIYRQYHWRNRLVLVVRENSQPDRVLTLSRFPLAFRMIRKAPIRNPGLR